MDIQFVFKLNPEPGYNYNTETTVLTFRVSSFSLASSHFQLHFLNSSWCTVTSSDLSSNTTLSSISYWKNMSLFFDLPSDIKVIKCICLTFFLKLYFYCVYFFSNSHTNCLRSYTMKTYKHTFCSSVLRFSSQSFRSVI